MAISKPHHEPPEDVILSKGAEFTKAELLAMLWHHFRADKIYTDGDVEMRVYLFQGQRGLILTGKNDSG